MLCLTWNVNEQRPDGSPLFKWIADLSAKASVAVIALQEIEMGGGSVAVAAAKDILNKSAQVSCLSGGCLSGELYLKKSHRAGTRSLQWQDRYSLYWLCQKQTLGTGACRCTVASPIFSSCCCVPARQCKTQACACFVHVLGSLPCLCCLDIQLTSVQGSSLQAVDCTNTAQAAVLDTVDRTYIASRPYMPMVQANSSNFLSSQEKGNNNAQWWQAQVMSTLGPDRWMRVGLRQLSGMLVMVFALSSLSVKSRSHAPLLPFCSCNKGCIMPVCCGTSEMHDAVQHTLCSCNKGCIMPVCCGTSCVLGAVQHTLCSAVQDTLCSCSRDCIIPVCCGSSNVHGAVYGSSPDVMAHGRCVMHLMYCGIMHSAAFPRDQGGRHLSKLTPSLEAPPNCKLCTCTT